MKIQYCILLSFFFSLLSMDIEIEKKTSEEYENLFLRRVKSDTNLSNFIYDRYSSKDLDKSLEDKVLEDKINKSPEQCVANKVLYNRYKNYLLEFNKKNSNKNLNEAKIKLRQMVVWINRISEICKKDIFKNNEYDEFIKSMGSLEAFINNQI